MEYSYRSYQRVLNISVKPSSLSLSPSTRKTKASSIKVTKPRKDDSQIKRRTKTGCFTCRKRKKKCDEDRVNGKCQACTRNFLECCWPEPAATNQDSRKELKAGIKSPTVKSTKCDINSLLSSPINQEAPLSPEITMKSMPSAVKQDANPYPSPIQSPISYQPGSPSQDVSFMTLPPLRNINYKLQAKDSNVRGSRFEDATEKENRDHAAESKDVPNTKFIITSFDSRKDLCEIKN
ncbi:Zcf3 predicted zinc-finger protein [Candida orthopsilosis Co 90-125]|uniref:Zcf3 predicted zinc-finger protein n=1 Tax=Candida orthopsilosis (strain 90-125) TaxID=1136231 RepID=H8X5B9_CANO9|nr:Zcf3 predicted zinc-finger protein [Candida orthopsilosis Co 90-125]CCG23212.1 Zcf3 predicted zinc-finger protein [Candida orthopsilosis Co 90-125]